MFTRYKNQREAELAEMKKAEYTKKQAEKARKDAEKKAPEINRIIGLALGSAGVIAASMFIGSLLF